MSRVLVDTNIVLDLLSNREEFIKETQILFTLSAGNKIKLFVSTLSFANTHYVLAQQLKVQKTQEILRKFKSLVDIVPFNEQILDLSLNSKFKDFEDAIQYYSALHCNAEVIISRNKKDFRLAELPVLDCKEYLKFKQIKF